MLKFIRPNVTPVGGFRYVDPDNGYKYERQYTSFAEMEAHVQEYRAQNRMEEIGNFREVWENWTCQEKGMDRHCCPVTATVTRKFEHYTSAGKLLIRTLMKKAKDRFVKQEVADARAKTCINCRSNVFNIGHRHAGLYAERYLNQFTAGRSTKYSDRLFTCRVCTCLLKAKVHFPSSEIAKSLKPIEISRLKTEPQSIDGKPLKCWQLEAVEKIKRGESDGDETEEAKEESGTKS